MISVVIPTCRRPELLARCLERLGPGSQTLAAEQFEVIVSDDGLPSAEALVRERFPWARWVKGPARGPASNRNSGARLARHPWIVFTDDDCVPSAQWLAQFAAATKTGADMYEGKTTCAAGIRTPLEHAPINLIGGCFWSCNLMISKEAFQSVGGFDEGFPFPHMEDLDLAERLKSASRRAEFVPAAVVDHPPRRQAPGTRLARHHESWMYWWYKAGRRSLGSPRLLWLILLVRAKTLAAHPFGVDTVRALGEVAAEVAALVVRLPVWEFRYRWRFRRTPHPH